MARDGLPFSPLPSDPWASHPSTDPLTFHSFQDTMKLAVILLPGLPGLSGVGTSDKEEQQVSSRMVARLNSLGKWSYS